MISSTFYKKKIEEIKFIIVMKKQNFLNTFSIIIGIFITFIISVKADNDDDNDNNECLVCDFLIGLVIGVCDSNPECSANMRASAYIIVIVAATFFSISFLCCMNAHEKRKCMKECGNNRPSLGETLRTDIATGAGYETGRSLFS